MPDDCADHAERKAAKDWATQRIAHKRYPLDFSFSLLIQVNALSSKKPSLLAVSNRGQAGSCGPKPSKPSIAQEAVWRCRAFPTTVN
jgi:hypothetical protein